MPNDYDFYLPQLQKSLSEIQEVTNLFLQKLSEHEKTDAFDWVNVRDREINASLLGVEIEIFNKPVCLLSRSTLNGAEFRCFMANSDKVLCCFYLTIEGELYSDLQCHNRLGTFDSRYALSDIGEHIIVALLEHHFKPYQPEES